MPVLGKDAVCSNCVFCAGSLCYKNPPDGMPDKLIEPKDGFCGEWMNQEMWDARCKIPPPFVSGEPGYVDLTKLPRSEDVVPGGYIDSEGTLGDAPPYSSPETGAAAGEAGDLARRKFCEGVHISALEECSLLRYFKLRQQSRTDEGYTESFGEVEQIIKYLTSDPTDPEPMEEG